jgi:hypothetical protein
MTRTKDLPRARCTELSVRCDFQNKATRHHAQYMYLLSQDSSTPGITTVQFQMEIKDRLLFKNVQLKSNGPSCFNRRKRNIESDK